jgi:hypothetical protein
MHLLGDAACVVSSCVFVTIYIVIIIILPYAPGKLQMESKTEGCLYPCGGAI